MTDIGCTAVPGGVELRATRRTGFLRRVSAIPAERLGDAETAELALAIGTLETLRDDDPESVKFEDEVIFVSHAALAGLSRPCADRLGLPPDAPGEAHIGTSGSLRSPDFSLGWRWFRNGRESVCRRDGAFLQLTDDTFRLPEPLFGVIEIIEAFREKDRTIAERWEALAKIKAALAGEEQPNVLAEPFIDDISISVALAVTVELTEGEDGVVIDPLPLDETGDPVLDDAETRTFQTAQDRGFRAAGSTRVTYLIDNGRYLIVDDAVRPALEKIRQVQDAPRAEREAFARNPSGAIRDAVRADLELRGALADHGEIGAEEAVDEQTDRIFLAPVDHADRIIGLGLWQPPVLPFITEAPNQWMPETFGLRIGDVCVPIEKEDVIPLREAVTEARRAGAASVPFNDVDIPATQDTEDAVAALPALEEPQPADGSNPKPAPLDRTVVQVATNLEDMVFDQRPQPRECALADTPPSSLKNALKAHQREGFEWMARVWRSGSAGALVADDQGLGKTFQTLAFLSWLKAGMDAPNASDDRRPILIVAPTTLLGTWEIEVETHVGTDAFGFMIRAYGSDLKVLRGARTGKDTDDGKAKLKFNDIDELSAAGKGHRPWVLTTYDTLANYQVSFSEVPFSAVVFDEIQMAKNPSSLRHRAALGVRADFRIGLTGTPIENALHDLWAIMEILVPGRLGDLRSFNEGFGSGAAEDFERLHRHIFHERPASDGGAPLPPLAMRRMKEDGVIEGLPAKRRVLAPEEMDDLQANAYDVALVGVQRGEQGDALRALHRMRSHSLHAYGAEQATDLKEYVDASARLRVAVDTLHRIRAQGERALVFIEDRAMQNALRAVLKTEFGLHKVAVINGATSIPNRKRFVERFQRHMTQDEGFDVMILGPKAAGFGLTLTAATHVIHLSRWWNPAVEAQCDDRVYRIGQTKDVTIHLPMAIHPTHGAQSFDCVLNELMVRKRANARLALAPPVRPEDQGHLIDLLNGVEGVDTSQVAMLDWASFEDWVRQRVIKTGVWFADETPVSGDAGADLVLRHRNRDQSALVQVKHWKNPPGKSAVDDVLRAAGRYGLTAPSLVVVTSAESFAESARQKARQNGVILIDRPRLGLWPRHVLDI